ncbi:MAG: hypothetical protein P1V34_15390 [Alphaproteobacteria bacterium]|nr:hypothetical protein [Alphaproteobacteria bacterium]
MGRMSPHCALNLKMIEGALLKGDWECARKLVVAWHCPEDGGCGDCKSCIAHRGLLHNVALTVKVMGLHEARKHLSRNLPVAIAPTARILSLQMANSSSV